jgi:acetolactate synthase-1/2/3 large subunit
MIVRRTRRAAADHKAIAEAVGLIQGARSPIILAGNGAVRKRAANQLRRLAHKAGIGVVNTFMGKGAVPRTDPHCLFTLGLQGRDYINVALDEADLIIAVGYDLVEYAPQFWNRHSGKKIVHIDFWPAEIDQHYPVDVDIVSDIADALWQINEELNRRLDDAGRLPLFDISGRAKLRSAILDDFAMEKDDASFPMKPQKILWDVREAMKPDSILLSDVGAHKMWISRYYQCDEANTCLISNGFCSMGFALPGALGAAYAHPGRDILAICGDAGFLMNVQDLETLARYKLPVTVMVWCDGEYGLIKWKQQNAFNGRHSQLAFNNPDFEYLAKAFGMWGRTVASAGELPGILREALAHDGPALVAVPVDYAENVKLTQRLGNLNFSI